MRVRMPFSNAFAVGHAAALCGLAVALAGAAPWGAAPGSGDAAGAAAVRVGESATERSTSDGEPPSGRSSAPWTPASSRGGDHPGLRAAERSCEDQGATRSHPAPHASAAWKAVAATGRVEARPPTSVPAAWSAVRRGDRLEGAASVRTQKRSRTTLARSGDVILVDPLTEIVLPEGEPGPAMTIRQGSGNALYRIEPSAERRVAVETPWLVAGVKGTVFSVIVETAYASVSVASGRVEVLCTVTGERADLGAGDMIVFDAAAQRMEIYRDRRRSASRAEERTEPEGEARTADSEEEISRSASESLDATIDLLEEASASLAITDTDVLALEEVRSVDLDVWTLERELGDLTAETSLKESSLLAGDEDESLLGKLGLTRR